MCEVYDGNAIPPEQEAVVVDAGVVDMRRWRHALDEAITIIRHYDIGNREEAVQSLREMRVLLSKLVWAKTAERPFERWLAQEIGG